MHPADDDEHVALAVKEGRVICTQDVDFFRLHATEIAHRGMVYGPQQTPVGVMVRGLMMVYEVLDAGDIDGQVEYL